VAGKNKSQVVTADKSNKKKAGSNYGAMLALLQSPGFLPRIRKLLMDSFRSFRIYNSCLSMRLGFADPADTGVMTGFLQPVFIWMNNSLLSVAQFEADFSQPVFHLKYSTHIRSSLFRLIYVLTGFLLSPAIWRAAINVRRVTKT